MPYNFSAVPPSSKPPTSALRIDRFLRPFTLKAVQELLGKTGKITNFWMDRSRLYKHKFCINNILINDVLESRDIILCALIYHSL